MGSRILHRSTGLLVLFAIVAMTGTVWAHWYSLGQSKDEWGLKYSGDVEASKDGKLLVRFTLADQGRLKPIHSVFVMVFGNSDRTGTNLVKTAIPMSPTEDGKLTGQVEIRQEFASRALIRIFTMTVDGRSHAVGPMAGARYYDIPVSRFQKRAIYGGPPQTGTVVAPRR